MYCELFLLKLDVQHNTMIGGGMVKIEAGVRSSPDFCQGKKKN